MMGSFNKIHDYYLPRIKEGKNNSEKLGWESPSEHTKRFQILVQQVDLHNMTILDVGCGFADLFGYIAKQQIPIKEYTGVDLLPEMIQTAKTIYPQLELYSIDIFKQNPFGKRTFDVVFCSGVFNIDLNNNIVFMQKAFKRFSELSTKYIVFNCLHKKSNQKEAGYFYTDPQEVALICDGKITFIEHYLNNDFTVICKQD